MRVLLASRSLPLHRSGGLEWHSWTLACGLLVRGHDVVVITSRLRRAPGRDRSDKSSPCGPAQETSGTAAVGGGRPAAGRPRVVPCRRGLPGRYELGYWPESRRLFRSLHRKRPFDVVVSEGWGAASILAAREWPELHVGAVMIVHGTSRSDLAAKRRRLGRSPLYLLARLKWALDQRLWNRAARRFDRLIAVSGSVLERIRTEFALEPARLGLVPNGVDTQLFRPREDRSSPASQEGPGPRIAHGGPAEAQRPGASAAAHPSAPSIRVVAAGRLHAQKGLDILLRAIASLSSRYPGLQLVLAGEGSHRGRLESLSRELGLTRCVRLPGQLSRTDLADLLRRADFFAFPTLCNEGLPLALLEAMASGLPILASSVVGVTDAVRDGKEALLVPPGDVPALAAGLETLVLDRERAAALGQAARRRCEEHFSIDRMLAGLAEEIERAALCGPGLRKAQ